MSRSTIVTDYVQNRLDGIKKDSFLEEISQLPFYRQRSLIFEEISQINDYISLIKDNKNSYQNIDGKKVLVPSIKAYIKFLKQIISKYQEYYHYLNLLNNYNNRQKNIDERIEFESTQVKLSMNQLKLLDNIDSNVIESISFNDLTDLSKYMIENYEFLSDRNLLLEVIKELINRTMINKYGESEFVAICSIKCLLKNKINSLDKNDELRKPLREIRQYLKSIIDINQKSLELQHDYRYEIVEYLLDDDYCFSRILEEMPDIVNLTDKEGYSLAYNVISKYLDLYLLELQGKQSKVPKEKYAKIYRKIIYSPCYNHDADYEIDILINSFKETIKNGRFKRDKYLAVLDNLDKIKDEKEDELVEDEFNSSQIYFETQNIIKKHIQSNRMDLTLEDTIVISHAHDKYYNYAYSITKNEQGNHILKTHITDVREFIKHDTELDNYLKRYMFYNTENWLDEKLMLKLSLEKGKVKPAITFEAEILPSGKVESFKCYKSMISVNDTYTYEDVNMIIKNHNMRLLPFLEVCFFLNKDVDKNNYGCSMIETFNKFIFDTLGRFFESNNLPYVYKTQEPQDSEKYIRDMTFLNQLFNKISQEDFSKFYSIICEDTNYAKYACKPSYHYSLDQKYYNDLFIPLYSYVGLHLQELINQFYLKKLPEEILTIKKHMWENENQYIVERANKVREQKRVDKHKEKVKMLDSGKHK